MSDFDKRKAESFTIAQTMRHGFKTETRTRTVTEEVQVPTKTPTITLEMNVETAALVAVALGEMNTEYVVNGPCTSGIRDLPVVTPFTDLRTFVVTSGKLALLKKFQTNHKDWLRRYRSGNFPF